MADESILTNTKKILGLAEDYEAFDFDVVTHINSTFSTLDQLGIGPEGGLVIEDKTSTWDELAVAPGWLSMIKTYTYLKVRMLFDPPSTSFTQEAMNKQIAEHEWRLSNYRELTVAPVPSNPEVVFIDHFTGEEVA